MFKKLSSLWLSSNSSNFPAMPCQSLSLVQICRTVFSNTTVLRYNNKQLPRGFWVSERHRWILMKSECKFWTTKNIRFSFYYTNGNLGFSRYKNGSPWRIGCWNICGITIKSTLHKGAPEPNWSNSNDFYIYVTSCVPTTWQWQGSHQYTLPN